MSDARLGNRIWRLFHIMKLDTLAIAERVNLAEHMVCRLLHREREARRAEAERRQG